MAYQPLNKVRIVTAASLFDGHDAAINIMRRIMQSKGAEIIHLGHNRSVKEIVETAIEEDVQGIAITSYQGGHVEFFKYMKDLLEENGCGHIKIFGGGGGTILPAEIEELHKYGITRIYSPDDGRKMGLEGMIEDVIRNCDVQLNGKADYKTAMKLEEARDVRKIAREITNAENGVQFKPQKSSIPVVGITGTGGAGKSSVTDEIVRRFLHNFTENTIAVISVDPSKKKTGGALLGDRIRMNSISHPRAYMRSLATRDDNTALSSHVQEAIDICKAAGYDLVILESAGVGQSDASILDHCDVSMYVMTPEYGAASQLEKINMLDYADLICINKFDKAGALDALADVRKQYKRNHQLFTAKDSELPVVGTMASKFNDDGVNHLFELLLKKIEAKTKTSFGEYHFAETAKVSQAIIPSNRVRYLSEISESNRNYDQLVKEQAAIASKLYQLEGSIGMLTDFPFQQGAHGYSVALLEKIKKFYEEQLTPVSRKLIQHWSEKVKEYNKDFYEYTVRDKVIRQPMFSKSLSGTRIPKVVLPKYKDWGDILKWQAQENVPGHFPFTAGVFPLKREGEDPTRMFAGEGSPERTNRRFHYVSVDQPAKRLSTAFDSVTLYGEDPDHRPDIYGKVGNSGVSIATVDDAKKLYSGFDLCDPRTSVSMTINGPAPMLLAFFMNAAIDQQCEKYILQNDLKEEINKIIETKYKINDLPKYIGADGKPVSPVKGELQGALPTGNNGLGLRLLGLSGADVLPKDVYDKIKAEALSQVRGTGQA